MSETSPIPARSQALELRDLLYSLTVRVREIRALSVVDQDGLTLESTLATGAMDESLAAFGGAFTSLLARAQGDFEMGPVYAGHISARDRQLFVVPVDPDRALAALVDPGATPATVTLHLLAAARSVAPLLDPAR